MTVLVAVESPSGVEIGCDTFVGSAGTKSRLGHAKWFQLGAPDLVVLYAGDLWGAQVAASIKRPRHTSRLTDLDYVIRVVRTIRAIHKDADVERDACDFLVVYRGGVYVACGYAVLRATEGYAAAGSGESFAFGALAATGGLPAKLRVKRALAAAARHCPSVAGPFHTATLPPAPPSP